MDLATLKKDIRFKYHRYNQYKVLYKDEFVGIVTGDSWTNSWHGYNTTDGAYYYKAEKTGSCPTRYQAAVALLNLQDRIHTIELKTQRISHVEDNQILSIGETYINDDKTQVLTRALIVNKSGKNIKNLMIAIDLKQKQAVNLNQKKIKIGNLDQYIDLIQKLAGKK